MKNIYENVKFAVTRNVLVFTFLSMALLTVFNLITNGNNLLTSILATLLSLITLLFLLKTKSYKISAYIAIVFGLSLNSYNLLGASNFENYIDFFWMINLILFAYFTLDRFVGNFYLFLNIIVLLVITFGAKLNYFSLRPPSYIYNFYTYLDFSMNFIISAIFFGYLVNQFLKQAKQAQKDAIVTNLKLKQTNNELQQQYDEKLIMLKEIHHRVKNNLQVITSLLRLQLYKLEDNKTREPFEESINRVNSMALIHEKMYKGDQVKDVNLSQYIYELADSLITNYSNYKNVKVNVKSEIETLNLDVVVPLSLIFNELISNSLKHAFKDNENGKIDINITKNNNKIILIYKDNGIWKEPNDANSFGLELIETFTEQLGGTYTINHLKGTKYIFKFEVY
jgi:two-component sensor histidine kinase